METNNRYISGKVVSDKMDKTIVIEVATDKMHPLYKKRVTTTKKVKVHDENSEAKIGDTVRAVETKPISKDKHYKLVQVVEKAIII